MQVFIFAFEGKSVPDWGGVCSAKPHSCWVKEELARLELAPLQWQWPFPSPWHYGWTSNIWHPRGSRSHGEHAGLPPQGSCWCSPDVGPEVVASLLRVLPLLLKAAAARTGHRVGQGLHREVVLGIEEWDSWWPAAAGREARTLSSGSRRRLLPLHVICHPCSFPCLLHKKRLISSFWLLNESQHYMCFILENRNNPNIH